MTVTHLGNAVVTVDPYPSVGWVWQVKIPHHAIVNGAADTEPDAKLGALEALIGLRDAEQAERVALMEGTA